MTAFYRRESEWGRHRPRAAILQRASGNPTAAMAIAVLIFRLKIRTRGRQIATLARPDERRHAAHAVSVVFVITNNSVAPVD